MKLRLTRAGVGAIITALVMLASGLMKTINLLILLGDLLLVVLILNAILAWWHTRGLSLQCGSCLIRSGRSGWHTARLTSRLRKRLAVVIRERSEIHESSTFVTAEIPAHEAVAVQWKVPSLPRGVYRSTIAVETGYPFGFVRCERTAAETHEVRVTPALGRIDQAAMLRWLARGGEGDSRPRRSASLVLQAGDVRGVRPYERGDSPRHIHWRTSARRCGLFVRDFEIRDSQDLVLALRLRRGSGVEEAVSLAATLLQTWCAGESLAKITLQLPDGTDISGQTTSKFAERLMAALADVHPHAQAPAPPVRRGAVHFCVSNDKPAKPAEDWRTLTPQSAPGWYHPPKGKP